jgi:hypothetical protein
MVARPRRRARAAADTVGGEPCHFRGVYGGEFVSVLLVLKMWEEERLSLREDEVEREWRRHGPCFLRWVAMVLGCSAW